MSSLLAQLVVDLNRQRDPRLQNHHPDRDLARRIQVMIQAVAGVDPRLVSFFFLIQFFYLLAFKHEALLQSQVPIIFCSDDTEKSEKSDKMSKMSRMKSVVNMQPFATKSHEKVGKQGGFPDNDQTLLNNLMQGR